MSRGRRVLEVLGRSAGGISAHVARVTEGLDGRDGLVVDVAGPPDLPIAMPKPIRPVVIPDGLRGHVHAVRALRSIVRAGGYEVVHAHGLRAGIDSGIAARGPGILRYVTVHNLVLPDVTGGARARLYRWAEPLAVRLNHKVFAPSEEIARHLRATIRGAADKVDVVPLGVGEEVPVVRSRAEVRAELDLEPDASLVVTVSRLHPQKALHVLLGALEKLPPRVHLAVVGEGPLEAELKETAAALRISERVAWLGFRDDVGDYLAAADVFCLSSRWEAVALAAKEAVLVDTPVVATDVGGMRELLEDGVSGRLVPSDDPSALAAALLDVLEHPDRAAAYARNARAAVAARFSTAEMLNRLYRAYTDAV
jgi:glycosyltransferase involved in cell wall biosynthesis